ncbi:hypothetical protein [Streptomyces nitrosporeus]|nr:hypothetical protein [Streptomyces nitrosporeus]GGZ19990.1 hypothetical protein GCM10010327_58990 [Streptomyces nitrosporeus]
MPEIDELDIQINRGAVGSAMMQMKSSVSTELDDDAVTAFNGER